MCSPCTEYFSLTLKYQINTHSGVISYSMYIYTEGRNNFEFFLCKFRLKINCILHIKILPTRHMIVIYTHIYIYTDIYIHTHIFNHASSTAPFGPSVHISNVDISAMNKQTSINTY